MAWTSILPDTLTVSIDDDTATVTKGGGTQTVAKKYYGSADITYNSDGTLTFVVPSADTSKQQNVYEVIAKADTAPSGTNQARVTQSPVFVSGESISFGNQADSQYALTNMLRGSDTGATQSQPVYIIDALTGLQVGFDFQDAGTYTVGVEYQSAIIPSTDIALPSGNEVLPFFVDGMFVSIDNAGTYGVILDQGNPVTLENGNGSVDITLNADGSLDLVMPSAKTGAGSGAIYQIQGVLNNTSTDYLQFASSYPIAAGGAVQTGSHLNGTTLSAVNFASDGTYAVIQPADDYAVAIAPTAGASTVGVDYKLFSAAPGPSPSPGNWQNAFAGGPCNVALYDYSDGGGLGGLRWSGSLSAGGSHVIDTDSELAVSVSSDGVVSLSNNLGYGEGMAVRVTPMSAPTGAARASGMLCDPDIYSGPSVVSASDNGDAVELTLNGDGATVAPDPAQPTDDPADYIQVGLRGAS